MLTRLPDKWRKLDPYIKQGFIIVASILLNVGCFLGISLAARWRAASEYTVHFHQADSVMQSVIDQQYPQLSKPRTKILQNQYYYLQQKKDFFEQRLVRFYVYYIAIVSCSLLMTLILAGLLAFIARQGWMATAPTPRFLFVMVALFATLYASVLAVFDLDKNATNNLQLFNDHKSVQIDIYDFLTTSGRFAIADSTKAFAKADTMIHNVNLQIKTLNRVYYSIDQGPIKQVSLDEIMSKASANPLSN
jgi:hypothetical protein